MPNGNISPQKMYDMILNANLPKLQSYVTSNKSNLSYRHYPSNSNYILILLHGISEDSKYLFPFAEYMASKDIAQVYTPNLRGYGELAERKGDVDYIGQIDEDLADLMDTIRKETTDAKIILGGHSFGGASVLRFSGPNYAKHIDSYLFLAPYIHPSAPIAKKSNEGGNSKVSMTKFVLLTLLEMVKIRRFHHWKVMRSLKPSNIQHGGEALEISFRLAMSRIPQNYKENIKNIDKPTLVLIGDEDEMLDSDRFDSVFKDNENIVMKVLSNHNHDGILFSDETYSEVGDWIARL